MAVDPSRLAPVDFCAALVDAQVASVVNFSTLRRTAMVTATSDMRLLVMFGADFAKLSDDSPELHDRIDAALEERLPK